MEKLIRYGVRSLTDSELIANIIRSGTREKSSLALSQKLIMDLGSARNVGRMTLSELMKFDGIGRVKACQIVAAFELGRRAARPVDVAGMKISNPSELVDFFKFELAEEEVEKFVIVHLSTNMTVIDWEVVSVGILNASLVHPREIYKAAIRACASSIIALHNHPSGNPEPSREDFLITKRLFQVGELVGIALVDHLVIAGNGYYSFRENQQLRG